MNLSRTKQYTKNKLILLHPASNLISKFIKNSDEVFLCVITPVYEPALSSVKKLVKDLKNQSYTDYIHVMISNGASPQIEEYVKKISADDPRFVYVASKYVPTPDFASLMSNLGSRRDYCLRTYNPKRFLFLDADMHIVDNNYFSKLFFAHQVYKKDIFVTNCKYHGTLLPIHPVGVEGSIQVSNYCFTNEIARKHRYPIKYDNKKVQGNDWVYWKKINKNSIIYLDFLATIEGDDRGYKRASDIRHEENIGKELISVFGNSFDNTEIEKVNEVLQSHLVGYGRVVTEFELMFSSYIGFRHAVATNSCTNALWVLLNALNLKSSDEVILPSIHFFGIVNILKLLNIKYKVAEVDSIVPNMNIESCMALITKNTKAIITLDYGGNPFVVKKLKTYLKKIGRQDIVLVLDAANSPFTKLNNKFIAKEYDYALYSFDMNKTLVTGEGGMILSNDREIMERCRSLSYYGIIGKSKSGFSKSSANVEWWLVGDTSPSLKLAMNNISAGIGLVQLSKVNNILIVRDRIVKKYYKKLQQLIKDGHIMLPPKNDNVKNANYLFWLLVKDKKTRNDLANFMISKNIYTTVKYEPLASKKYTPNAWAFFDKSICIPLNQNMDEPIIDYIVSQLLEFFYEG